MSSYVDYNGSATFTSVPAGTVTVSFTNYNDGVASQQVTVTAGQTTTINKSFLCFVAGTKIRLADGTDKNVEDITYDDELLVWDFDNACYASAKPAWIMEEADAPLYMLSRYSDGRILKTAGYEGHHHEIFDYDSQMFDYTDNMAGRSVMTLDGVAKCESVELVHEHVKHYNIITDRHFNLFANGILTSCQLNKLYPIKDMKFVKDGRSDSDYDYSNVPEKLVTGLRLLEQPDYKKEYVERIVATMKKD